MATLVTGVTGLLGNNVLRLLAERGEPVRALVRAGSDPRPLEALNVERAEGDVCDAASVRRAVEGVERVVHCAGFVRIGWTKLEEGRQINVVGSRNVAQAARAVGARLAHISTINGLGLGAAAMPANEELPYSAAYVPCTYVVTKREAELAVLEEVEKGLHGVIASPGFMIGPWDWKPSSGKMILEVARRSPPVSPWGGVSVCDARDVAAGVLAALERGKVGHRYILAGQNMLYFELWSLIASITGGRAPRLRAGPMLPYLAGKFGDWWGALRGREGEVNSAAVAMSGRFLYCASSRAKDELGYRSRPPEQSIADAWAWFKRHGYA